MYSLASTCFYQRNVFHPTNNHRCD